MQQHTNLAPDTYWPLNLAILDVVEADNCTALSLGRGEVGKPSIVFTVDVFTRSIVGWGVWDLNSDTHMSREYSRKEVVESTLPLLGKREILGDNSGELPSHRRTSARW